MTPSTGPRTPSWMPTLRDIGEAVLTLLTTTVGLAVAVAVIDGILDSPAAIVFAAAVVAAGDLLLRAPLRFLRGEAVPLWLSAWGCSRKWPCCGSRCRSSPASTRTPCGPSSASSWSRRSSWRSGVG